MFKEVKTLKVQQFALWKLKTTATYGKKYSTYL